VIVGPSAQLAEAIVERWRQLETSEVAMQELFPIPLDEQIACVEREIAMRRRVYARWVSERKMSPALADKQIALMEAVLDSLRWMKDHAR